MHMYLRLSTKALANQNCHCKPPLWTGQGRPNANLLTKLGIVASLPITNQPDPAPPSLASSKATVTHDKGELANTYTLGIHSSVSADGTALHLSRLP